MREQIARALMYADDLDPDVFIGMHGTLGHYGETADAILPLMEKVAQAAIDASAEVCRNTEGPFDEHSQAPENCAFYYGTELAEFAVYSLDAKAIVEGVK